MKNYNKRLAKIENIIKTKCNHHGLFLYKTTSDAVELLNKEVDIKHFINEKELLKFIYANYNCEKYVFIKFDIEKLLKNK